MSGSSPYIESWDEFAKKSEALYVKNPNKVSSEIRNQSRPKKTMGQASCLKLKF